MREKVVISIKSYLYRGIHEFRCHDFTSISLRALAISDIAPGFITTCQRCYLNRRDFYDKLTIPPSLGRLRNVMGLMPLDAIIWYTEEWHEFLARLDFRTAFDDLSLLLLYVGRDL